jgi:hypothetical protein
MFFLVFSNHFDVLISKINLKKIKKHYFNTFSNEKHFENQPHSQTGSNLVQIYQTFVKSSLFLGLYFLSLV